MDFSLSLDIMIRQFIFWGLLFFSIATFGQSISKRYSTHLNTSGVVYFFTPQKVTKGEKGYSLEYDMTYVTNTDSITVNLTLKSPKSERIKLLSLRNSSDSVWSDKLKLFYVDKISKGYEFRIHTTLLFSDIKKMFRSPEALEFSLVQGDQTLNFGYANRSWKKEMKCMEDIFNLIKIQDYE